MSGLIERIVRARRASAMSRLGPPPYRSASVNGWAPPPEVEPEPEAPQAEAPEPAAPAPEPEPEAETIAFPTVEPEPPPELAAPAAPPPAPSLRERARIRRRIRYLRSLREVQLRDLGGFMLELHRFGADRPELVDAKREAAARTDAELRALQRSLGADEPMRELREPAIGGACTRCGAVHGTDDRFCATCGEPLRRVPEPDPVAPPEPFRRPEFPRHTEA